MSSGDGERRACEFQLLRYVPDAVRNEYVHIGVILREQGSRDAAEVRFTRDWRKVRCLDPDADTALLEGMEGELRRRFQAEPEGNLMRLLTEALSLSVQMTSFFAGSRARQSSVRVHETGVDERRQQHRRPSVTDGAHVRR